MGIPALALAHWGASCDYRGMTLFQNVPEAPHRFTPLVRIYNQIGICYLVKLEYASHLLHLVVRYLRL